MSWDLFVQDLPPGIKDIAEIPDDFTPAHLGSRSEIIRVISELAPHADLSDSAWIVIDCEDHKIEVNLGDSQLVSSFAIHIRGAETAIGFAADLLSRFSWRAIDAGSDSGIFDPINAASSLAKWRAYRERVLGLR